MNFSRARFESRAHELGLKPDNPRGVSPLQYVQTNDPIITLYFNLIPSSRMAALEIKISMQPCTLDPEGGNVPEMKGIW